MKYFWRALRGRQPLSHVFWPGFGVMFLYSFIIGLLNSPFGSLPSVVWKGLNYTATAFAIWFGLSLWMCAYNSRWRMLGHMVRAGILIYLVFALCIAAAYRGWL